MRAGPGGPANSRTQWCFGSWRGATKTTTRERTGMNEAQKHGIGLARTGGDKEERRDERSKSKAWVSHVTCHFVVI
jgi:hypothetical protein